MAGLIQFTKGSVSPSLKRRYQYNIAPDDFIPLKTVPISKFKELLVKFSGSKRCSHKRNGYYIYKGQAYLIRQS